MTIRDAIASSRFGSFIAIPALRVGRHACRQWFCPLAALVRPFGPAGAIRLGTLGLFHAPLGLLDGEALGDALVVADVAALALIDTETCDSLSTADPPSEGSFDNIGYIGPRYTRRPEWRWRNWA